MSLQDRMHKLTLKEAAKLGVTVESTESLTPEREPGTLASTFRAVFLLNSQAKTMSIYRFARGNLRFAYFAPFDGVIAHPGQYHAVLAGCLPRPVARVSGGLRGRWSTDGDQALEQRLESSAALMAAVKKLSWQKGLAGPVIDLAWVLQIRATGDGRSHVVMQAGTYSGLLLQKPGIEAFLRLVDALSPLLSPAAAPAQRFSFDCYDGPAQALLAQAA